jgi:hypothetical protein
VEYAHLRYVVLTAETMKTALFWGVTPCVALVRTEVSEECSISIITVTRNCELGTTLAVTSNRRTLRKIACGSVVSYC